MIEKLLERKALLWINPKRAPFEEISEIEWEEVLDGEERWQRFAPLLMKLFPETIVTEGIIESKLTKITGLKETLLSDSEGDFYIKEDNNLPIAGSIKARGGIYEILKYAEKIALEKCFSEEHSYEELAKEKYRNLFSDYKIQVGSTGNLGLSIGIISAKLGFQVIVHMSSDAKKWKKELLREKGAVVKEYSGDFSQAVESGRKESDADPSSYFVDDENSKDLFVGYAAATIRLEKQLLEEQITVDENHPLFVYIPCGVGGGPGGIAYGLKKIYGENVHVFFIEPIESPSMLLGLATGKMDQISVQDIGLSGKTEADGLAVGRTSGFAARMMSKILSGVFTVEDKDLPFYMREVFEKEKIFIEPSGCAALEGPIKLFQYEEGRKYLEECKIQDKMKDSAHILWATGGRLVPEELREELLQKEGKKNGR